MESGIKIRKQIFEKLMKKNNNKKNWEMLCCSDKPLVPFIGAGISAWCYPEWEQLLIDIAEKIFSEECADAVRNALKCTKNPKVDYVEQEEGNKKADGQGKAAQKPFHWMEEIAECMFDDDKDKFQKSCDCFRIVEDEEHKKENIALKKLRDYFGEESPKKKREANKALNEAFSDSKLKETGGMPEYQRFFPKLFSDILITTNYDKVLEKCYPSIFSYSYMDLNEKYNESEKSWLFRAVEAKLGGEDRVKASVTVPDIPMLLKVHGSIEQIRSIALSREQYERAYSGEMPFLLQEICQKSTLIFMGCGLREDRTLDEMKKLNQDKKMHHFAFYSVSDKEEIGKKEKELEENYGIYPIFYDEEDVKELFEEERGDKYHEYCLGLLLENLLRRTMHYPQPLELLWDKDRLSELEPKNYLENIRREWIMKPEVEYVHMKELTQIWRMLNSSEECPLIAVIGKVGSGTSTLCKNMQELNKVYKDGMQFFHISLANCKSWDEFCIQIFQNLNIIELEIPKQDQWRKVADLVGKRCSGYWRSVLILDRLDELKKIDMEPWLWETITQLLAYWKEHQTRVVFTCRDYPKGVSCFTWYIGELKKKDAIKVFFSACTSKRYRNISFLEKDVIRELFDRQNFQAASVYLLGKYANSKNDLAGLLEEWELYHKPGDSEGQILARILWIHLLDEHRYEEKDEKEKEAIKNNILWIWGILGDYPGIVPKVFFENVLKEESREEYKNRDLSKKTIIFMKNAGLCEEAGDEKQSILLKNMTFCAEKYFFGRLEEEKYGKIKTQFLENTKKVKEGDDGLKCFRGYSMDQYNGKLRKYVCSELENEISEKRNEPKEDILELLKQLGTQINDDNKRKKNKKLNLVLHYEIKTVISFLCTYLSQPEIEEEKKKKVAEIGYSFLHYFHYVPNYAYPLVCRLLQIMRSPEEKQIYKLANLNRVMGDIQRLLGRKKDALDYYNNALKLCDEQMLAAFVGNDDNIAYKKSRRIRASTLLARNYYIGLDDNSWKGMEEAKSIYESIHDEWREADYHQRMGEMLFAKACREGKKEKKIFHKIISSYNQAMEIYNRLENKTGIAYILKCMGDLIGEFKGVYDYQADYYLVKENEGEDEFYMIQYSETGHPHGKVKNAGHNAGDRKDGAVEESRGDWLYAVASCYAQAFVYYCGHINWRGLANVIQAMGTAYRVMGKNGNEKENIGAVEKLYGLAEECYRWLGDTRGLADTLDYFGYGYKECEDEKYYYMALSKWTESNEIWKNQGDEAKAAEIDEEIKRLRMKCGGLS